MHTLWNLLSRSYIYLVFVFVSIFFRLLFKCIRSGICNINMSLPYSRFSSTRCIDPWITLPLRCPGFFLLFTVDDLKFPVVMICSSLWIVRTIWALMEPDLCVRITSCVKQWTPRMQHSIWFVSLSLHVTLYHLYLSFALHLSLWLFRWVSFPLPIKPDLLLIVTHCYLL